MTNNSLRLIPGTRVYRRRWWILAVFCLPCILQTMIWNTWGPIAESAEIVFDWTDGNVAFASNISDIGYIIFVIPLCIVMDTKGLRLSVLMSTAGFALGSLLRCFSMDPTISTITAYICGFSNGVAATIPFSAPPLVASVWFPPSERHLATAIGSFFNYFGLSISFIIGPYLVPGPEYAPVLNMTRSNTLDNAYVLLKRRGFVTNTDNIKRGILKLLYSQTGLAVLAFILILAYFPDRPPIAPSVSAASTRTHYKEAVQQILRNGPLWLIVLSGSLAIGISFAWIAILDVSLKPLGVTQIDAGWIGFWHSLIGCFCGIIVARFSEFFSSRRKMVLLIMFVCATMCAIWLNLLCSGYIAFDLRSLYASCIMLGVFINGATPLIYEMCVEASYPVAEGVTGGWFTLVSHTLGVIYLSVVSVPSLGTSWMTWTVLASTAVSVPLLLTFQERYKRTDVDLINRESSSLAGKS